MTGESSSNNEVLTNLNLNGLLGENAVFFIEHDQVRIGCKVDYGFAVKHLVEQFASMRLTGELKIFDGQVVEKRQHRFYKSITNQFKYNKDQPQQVFTSTYIAMGDAYILLEFHGKRKEKSKSGKDTYLFQTKSAVTFTDIVINSESGELVATTKFKKIFLTGEIDDSKYMTICHYGQ